MFSVAFRFGTPVISVWETERIDFMAAKRELKKGLDQFSDLNVYDRRWVLRKLPKSQRDLLVREIQTLSDFAEIDRSPSTVARMPTVFLSHSSKDKPFVRALAQRLKNAGIRVWLDEAEIRVGESLIEKLSAALGSVDFLLVVLSRSSIKSSWVQKEVEIAMNDEIKRRRVKVLPILKEAVRLPVFLEGKAYIDFTNKSSRARAGQKLVRDILSY
jgi:hypothetical protein